MEKVQCYYCGKDFNLEENRYWIKLNFKGVITRQNWNPTIKTKKGDNIHFCGPKCLLKFIYSEDFPKVLEELTKEKNMVNKFDLYFKKLKNTTKSTIVKTLKKVEETIEKI